MRLNKTHILCLALALLLGLHFGSTPLSTPDILAQDAPEKKTDPFAGWNKRVAETHLDFRHYYKLDEVDATINMFARKFPELCSVEVVGKSYEGRDMLALTLCNDRTGTHDTKPAMYTDSNIHGNEPQGTEMIIVAIWYLIRNYGHVPYVTRMVDTRTFYFIPVVNLDGRFHFFSDYNTYTVNRWNHKPADNDRDGMKDEDGPEDLDGDNRILQMRKADPDGDWVISKDGRSMVRRGAEQEGRYRIWNNEGLDNDEDGQINEDGPGGVDMNRNFPSGWEPPYVQFGSGDYPCSEIEIRACVDYILARPNISGMQFYHNTGHMILRPPGSSSDAGVVPAEDKKTFDILGRHGENFLPGYKYMQTHDELYAAYGTQIDFGYLGLGRFCFTNELWTPRMGADTNKNGKIDEEEKRRWYDDFGHGRSYHEWKKFDHPQLGEIEIGGYDQFTNRIAPAEMFIEEGFRNALFTIYHAEAFAELEINDVRVSAVDDDHFRINLAVRNKGVMPTDSKKAVQRKTDSPVNVSVSGAEIVMCGTSSDMFGKAVKLQKGRQDALRIARIAGRSSRYGEIIVRGKSGDKITLKARHLRAVKADIEVTLPQ